MESRQQSKVRILLQELLTVRGDREQYYCGRDALWEFHPDLVDLISTFVPLVFPDLLDLHMWSSKVVSRGKHRVNYYISHLWGNPEVYPVATDAPYAKFARFPGGQLKLLEHPVRGMAWRGVAWHGVAWRCACMHVRVLHIDFTARARLQTEK